MKINISIENKKKLKYLIFAFAVLLLVVVGSYIKKNLSSKNLLTSNADENKQKISDLSDMPSMFLVENGNGIIEKVQISTGKVEPANLLEQGNFNSFDGFPRLGDNNKKNVEQYDVLVDQGKYKALVTVATYESATATQTSNPTVLDTRDYLCDIDQKKCEQSNLFTQTYAGIDQALLKNRSLIWFRWDSDRKLLFGQLVSDNIGDTSLVYVCDTQEKICSKTKEFYSMQASNINTVLPTGAFSPTSDKFVLVNQYDKLNEETGKQWELLLYTSNNLLKPIKTYDLSGAINHDETTGYDRVYSVAWSQNEKQLAIATSSQIFMFDFKTGVLSNVYTDPVIEGNDLNLDSSALFLSSDGKYIAFIDATDMQDESTDESFNVLKRIDLEKNNEVIELLSDDGLSLKLQ